MKTIKKQVENIVEEYNYLGEFKIWHDKNYVITTVDIGRYCNIFAVLINNEMFYIIRNTKDKKTEWFVKHEW